MRILFVYVVTGVLLGSSLCFAQPKTVLDLQTVKKVSVARGIEKSGKPVEITLTNLNPNLNVWFLVDMKYAEGQIDTYHLENPFAQNQAVELNPSFDAGLVLGKTNRCSLWTVLPKLNPSRDVYVSLCDGRLFLRNATKGHKTTKEWATDFLRLYVPGGEKITTFVRSTWYKDAFVNLSELIEAKASRSQRVRPTGAPVRPLIDAKYENQYLMPDALGIDVVYDEESRMLAGRWYAVKDMPGIFISVVQPRLIAESVGTAQKGLVKPLDDVEAGALCYLLAFDLSFYDLRFALGTEHPQVNWSDRVMSKIRDANLLGPDGFETVAPLVRTGLVNPIFLERVVGTFTGGFKRYHGAFRQGALAEKNHGSHYGFVENGVVLSRLQPGLATVLVYDDGTVDLKTWSDADSVNLSHVWFARQNGVPIVEMDRVTKEIKPGALVASWQGNWSGAVDGNYRTLRAGLALQESAGQRFLIYGYFSTATPSAMARIFQAYHCTYAMLTDMNALEHTYLALYPPHGQNDFQVQHLIRGMDVLDKVNQGQVVPRFVGFADNRDFFYVLKKDMP